MQFDVGIAGNPRQTFLLREQALIANSAQRSGAEV